MLIQRLDFAGQSQRAIASACNVAQSTVSKILASAPAPEAHAQARLHLSVPDGHVVVVSDAHYWPGEATTAHRGMLNLINRLVPNAVIMNGDAFDGARISRHPSIGWEKRPKLLNELQAVEDRMFEIQLACRISTELIWTLGNHDMRFETRLAAVAPEYEGLPGFHLKDHFPAWTPAWSCWINNNTVIKHRFKGGVHGAYNNTIHSGLSCVTGHTHRCLVTPYSDYRGTRFGVETGTLAEPYGPQFIDYTEDNPVNWQSGFAVLTFRGGELLPPELVYVVGPGQIAFRGSMIDV